MCDFLIFQDGSRPPSLICLERMWTIYEEHPLVSYHGTKFGCSGCTSSNNTQFSIFGAFGFETPIDAPKNCFLKDMTAKMEYIINKA